MERMEMALWGLDFLISGIAFWLGGPLGAVLCFLAGGILILIAILEKERASASVLVDATSHPYHRTARRAWHQWGLALFILLLVGLGILGVVRSQERVKTVDAAPKTGIAPSQSLSSAESKQLPPKQSTPKPEPGRKQSGSNSSPAQPTIHQDCGGGNCAASYGQQGGITAGQVNIGRTERDLTERQSETFAAFYEALPTSFRLRIRASVGDEAGRFASLILNALNLRRKDFIFWDQRLDPESRRPKGVFIFTHPRQIGTIEQLCSDLIASQLQVDCYEDPSQQIDLITIYVGESR